MLATAGTLLRGGDWAVEPKLDGWRAIVEVRERVTIHTRTGRDITDQLPDLQALRGALDGRSATFDGELVIGQGLPEDFYRLGPRLAAKRPGEGVMFAAFDLLEVDGESLLREPYRERRRRLDSLLDRGPAWLRIPSFTDDPGTVFAECVRIGLEGIVAKRCSSRYQPGKRSTDWLKAKAPDWSRTHAARRHE